MLRRPMLALSSLVLAAGLTTAVPAAPATAYDNSVGVIKVPDQIRKSGCADYLVRWSFHPPTKDWTVVAKIRNPLKQSVSSQIWDADAGNARARTYGSLTFVMCGANAPVGRYSVSMQMIYTADRTTTTVNRAPTYFRLVQRR